MTRAIVAEPQSEAVSEPPCPPARRGPHPIPLGAASGVLLFLAFEPVAAWWLVGIALAPLLALATSNRSGGAIYGGAWIGGLIFWVTSLEWVRVSDSSAWPGWLAMALVLSLWWPIAVGLIRLGTQAGLPLMIAAPAAWVAVEYLRGMYPFNGFQWFYLSQAIHGLRPLIQIADLTGAWGLSALLVMLNVWWLEVIEAWRAPAEASDRRWGRRQTIGTIAVATGWLACAIYGGVRLAGSAFEPGPRLALLQSDFPQRFDNPQEDAEIIRTFGRLIDEATAAAKEEGVALDLIVWPETMYPYHWTELDPELTPAQYAEQVRSIHPEARPAEWTEHAEVVSGVLRRWVDRTGVPMLIGLNSYRFAPGGPYRHNAALLLAPDVSEAQAYLKRHLVPFGEYVPLVETLPWLLALTPFDAERMPNLDPGPAPSGLRLGDWTLSVVICFEDSVPWVARDAVRAQGGDGEDTQSADLLLNLSNDGWFRGTAAHELHLANSVLRAVELRTPVARAVNTGISALIDGNGRVRERLEAAESGVLIVEVPLDRRGGVYMWAGDWLAGLCLAVAVGAVPVALIRRRRAPRA